MAFRPVKSLLPELMRQRRITPQELANALDMSIQEVSDHANTRKITSLPKAKLYAEFFGIPIDDLYVWKAVPPRKRGRQKSE